MRSFFLILVLILPNIVSAACKQDGATVVYINGIFTSEKQAGDDLKDLYLDFVEATGNLDIGFINGYNPSHFEGVGDLAQAASQIFERPISTFDRDTILLQIHPKLTTRRLLLVGHSQGTFYTNEIYKYLLAHGEPKEAVGVYNIASPATEVAGNGKHLNSTNDHLLNWVQGNLNKDILPRNIFIPIDLGDITSKWPGHGISKAYLAGAADRVVSDIEESLSQLKPTYASEEGECFSAPERSLAYNTKAVLFGAGDAVVKVGFTGLKVGWMGATLAFDGVIAGIAAASSLFDTLSDAVTPDPRTENLPGSFTILSGMYGSSLTEKDLIEFGLINQGAAVALARGNVGVDDEPEDKPVLEVRQEIEGEVQGEETEKPFEPLIPSPAGAGGGPVSPGFGGGGGGAATETESSSEEDSGDPAPSSAPVPDGVPPLLVSLTADGFALQSSYTSLLQAPLATSGTMWHVRMEFDEDVATAPAVVDSPPNSPSRTSRAVEDCGDTDSKTFCFTYPATPGQQASTASRLDQWAFEISGAADASGEVMTPATYSFAIETLAPAITLGGGAVNSALPAINGRVSEHQTVIQVLVDGHFLTTTVGDPFIFIPGAFFSWQVTLQPGQELTEGYHDVQASSTDAVGNTGPIAMWQMLVDLTAPTVNLIPDIVEGSSIATTTGHIQVQTSDSSGSVSHTCYIDGVSSTNCTGLDISMVDSGTHVFEVVAIDAGGNQTTLTRNFTVLP